MKDLSGRTLLVTRAAGDAEVLGERIEALGGRALLLPCIECVTIREPGTSEGLRAALGDADWLALTSRRGAESAAELLGEGFTLPPRVRVACVGESTAEAARGRIGRCDLVPPVSTGEGLAQSLAELLRGQGTADRARVVFASADRAGRQLEETLEPLGTWVSRVPVYRTVPAAPRDPRHRLDDRGIDAVLLASPSAVRGLLNQVHPPAGAATVTLGPSTTRAARSLGLERIHEAARPDLEALLEAVP